MKRDGLDFLVQRNHSFKKFSRDGFNFFVCEYVFPHWPVYGTHQIMWVRDDIRLAVVGGFINPIAFGEFTPATETEIRRKVAEDFDRYWASPSPLVLEVTK